MSKILYAQEIVDAHIENLRHECTKLSSMGYTPYLKILLVGNDPASHIYTRNKLKFSEKIGAKCEIINLDENIPEVEFLELVDEINNDPDVHGLLIQKPLPKQLEYINVHEILNPIKDVDGFHFRNFFHLFEGKRGEEELIPCTPKGIMTMLNHYNIPVKGKYAVVIGRSLIVGRPMAELLTNHDATVTLCHLETKDIALHTRDADIIIVATGNPKFFGPEYFNRNKNQVVIDVGINKDENNKLCGDVDFDRVKDMVQAISPVPKGVGPMTILSLAHNLIIATRLNIEKNNC